MALRGQLLLRGSTTRVINHEGKWLCEGDESRGPAARANGVARVMNHEGLRRGSSTITNCNYFALFRASSFFLIAVVMA